MTDRIIWLSVAGGCTFLMGLLPVLIWHRKERDMRPVWLGMTGFLCFAVIAESFFQLLCFTALGPVSRALNASPWRLIAFSCLCAGLFEECGRLWIFRTGLSTWKGRGVAGGYAIGHIAMEIAAFCLWPLLSRPPVLFGAAEAELYIAERAMACMGHAALSVLVWKACSDGKKSLVAWAVILHALCDLPLGMLKYGLLEPVPARALFAGGVTVLFLFSLRYWQTMPPGVIIGEERDLGEIS
jgi:uncharacterized membrane protein YhfC